MIDEKAMIEAERILKELEQAALDDLKSIKEATVPAEFDGSIGRLTRIDAHQQQQMALHGQRSLERKLERIGAALIRVKEGTYGVCPLCGAAIAPVRLEAAPEVPFCVPCQERIDRQGGV